MAFYLEFRISEDGSIGGADLDVVDILASHIGFRTVKRREWLWGKWGKDGRILEEGTVGRVSEKKA